MSLEPPASDGTPRILSLGSVNADFQVRTERRPEISETLFATDFMRLSGGKSANVAFLGRKLGLEAALFAHVGNDDLAEQALSALRDIGVDLSGVKTVHGQSTGVAMITVPPDGKKGIVMSPNANTAWSSEDIEHVMHAVRKASSGSVLVTNCEIPVSVVEQIMHAARQCGIRTVLDPSPGDRVTDTLLGFADFVTPNAGEAKSITGIECKDPESALAAAKQIRERGARAVCIKLSDGGCVMLDEEGAVRIDAVPVEVVDSTGAGDAFAGALAVAMLEQQTNREAARTAVAASHLAVTAYGSQPAYPNREQLQEMIQRLTIRSDVK